MTTTAWDPSELDRVDAADELQIAPARRDGMLRSATPVWVVRVGDDLYVRSWRGPNGAWFRAARANRRGHISAGGIEKDVAFVDADDELNDAVDAAYRVKYQRYPDYVPPMVAPQARATTLRLVPEETGAQLPNPTQ